MNKSAEGTLKKSLPRYSIWAVAIVIALLTFSVYFPALDNKFVSRDDEYAYKDPHMQSLDMESFAWMVQFFKLGIQW